MPGLVERKNPLIPWPQLFLGDWLSLKDERAILTFKGGYLTRPVLPHEPSSFYLMPPTSSFLIPHDFKTYFSGGPGWFLGTAAHRVIWGDIGPRVMQQPQSINPAIFRINQQIWEGGKKLPVGLRMEKHCSRYRSFAAHPGHHRKRAGTGSGQVTRHCSGKWGKGQSTTATFTHQGWLLSGDQAAAVAVKENTLWEHWFQPEPD